MTRTLDKNYLCAMLRLVTLRRTERRYPLLKIFVVIFLVPNKHVKKLIKKAIKCLLNWLED